ncbi:hypothetical protein RJT34_16453 [Clitoria ternatea]|uniref:Uncharacterized protein n=1 Tax=Clitoria ternatea TaxID=43366 RepID=A0AAN9PC97_CLITE
MHGNVRDESLNIPETGNARNRREKPWKRGGNPSRAVRSLFLSSSTLLPRFCQWQSQLARPPSPLTTVPVAARQLFLLWWTFISDSLAHLCLHRVSVFDASLSSWQRLSLQLLGSCLLLCGSAAPLHLLLVLCSTRSCVVLVLQCWLCSSFFPFLNSPCLIITDNAL